MATKNEQDPTEPSESDSAREHTPRIVRFAQYTSPVMLAMLTSAGKDAALAQTLPP